MQSLHVSRSRSLLCAELFPARHSTCRTIPWQAECTNPDLHEARWAGAVVLMGSKARQRLCCNELAGCWHHRFPALGCAQRRLAACSHFSPACEERCKTKSSTGRHPAHGEHLSQSCSYTKSQLGFSKSFVRTLIFNVSLRQTDVGAVSQTRDYC